MTKDQLRRIEKMAESKKLGLTPDQSFQFVLHQDNLMWSRLQTIEAIQLATLGGAYAIRKDTPAAVCVIVLGIILTLLIFGLLKRDQIIRDRIQKAEPSINWSPCRKWFAPLMGRETTWVLTITMILADAAMAVAILQGKLSE